jgi:ankyrin repeat protein
MTPRSLKKIDFLNTKLRNQETMDELHEAIRCREVDKLESLLTLDNINTQEAPTSRTILHTAVFNSVYDCTKHLLKKGADVNAKDVFGRTPLLLAVSDNNFDIIDMLIEAGADINTIDKFGNTPFTLSLCHGEWCAWRSARLLIELGANTDGRKQNVPPYITSYIAKRLLCRRTAIAVISTHKKTHMIQQNGKDALRIIAKHIWSERTM